MLAACVMLRMDNLNEIKALISVGNVKELLKHQEFISSQIHKVIESAKPILSKRLLKISEDPISTAYIPREKLNISPRKIHKALKSSSNGDCLYNSASILTCGDEQLSDLLRGAVSIELLLHKRFYACHPFISQKQTNLSKKCVFPMCLKNSSSIDLKNDSDSKCLCIQNEAFSNCEKGVWSSQMCLLGLASVLQCPIISLYPSTGTDYDYVLNGRIDPRQKSEGQLIHILWSRSVTVTQNLGPFRSNHFTPVLEKDLDNKLSSRKRSFETGQNQNTLKSSKIMFPTISKLTGPRKEDEIKPNTGYHNASLLNSIDSEENQSKELQSSAVSNKFDLPPPDLIDEFQENSILSLRTNLSGQKNDIYLLFDAIPSLTDKEKLDLINNIWRPESSYSFKKSGKRNNCCQRQWLEDNNWLIYSEISDALYCLNCIFFPSSSGQKSKLCSKDGLRCWSSVKKKISTHADSPFHRHGSSKMSAFQTNVKDPSKAVSMLWDKAAIARINANKSRMLTVIRCVIYLAKQGLSFRGHREDGDSLDDPNNNPGNFKALLQLLRDLGNPDIAYLIEDAPKNATYTSKTICNQIIDVLGDAATETILKDVRDANFFGIMADEARDISNQEQLSLVVRFVDTSGKIREEFIKFIHCDKGCSGEALSKLILDEISKLGLNMKNCRAQAYDGAGAMAGKNKGVGPRIINKFPKIILIHCFSHTLNLSVMKMIRIDVVRDMFDNVRVISDFFNNSPKRFEQFEVVIKSLFMEPTKLINVCRTRWVERIEGLARFREAYAATLMTLSKIKSNERFHDTDWNPETRATANGLYKCMRKFVFIVALVVCQEILEYIHALTVSLQGSTLAVVEAYENVSTVIATLEGMRISVDAYHEKWYSCAVRLANSVGVEAKAPRICTKQTLRNNTPAPNDKVYFLRTITIPMLNEVIEDLKNRFNPKTLSFIGGFYCLPSIMKKFPLDWKLKLLSFMELYEDDMPRKESFEAEINCWETLWLVEFNGELPDTVQKTLEIVTASIFPNIYQVLVLIAVIPVTTCSCERCISVLRRLKTYLRSRMTQDRFNDLALIHIHYGLKFDVDDILQRLIIKYPKRIKMRNILYDEEEYTALPGCSKN